MHKVHRPGLVRSRRRLMVASEFRLDPTLGCFVAQLQAYLAIQAIDPLGIYRPAFAPQQHMNAPIAVAHAGSGDLLDPFAQLSLPSSTRAVVVGRSIDWQRAASTSNAHPPGRPRMIHHLTLPGRLQSFRRITSCSIALSSLAAMSFIVLPLPPRRAAVAGNRAYRKWRGAAPLRGR